MSFADVRSTWDDDRRESAIATAGHPVEYADPDLPADPFVVDAGDGWDTVVPWDGLIENMIIRRSAAEWYGYEILRDIPSYIRDADEYDLVEVDAKSVEYGERRRNCTYLYQPGSSVLLIIVDALDGSKGA